MYNKYITFTWTNPLRTYNRVSKIFKSPRTKSSLLWMSKFDRAHRSKILDIRVHDIIWKDKWDSPRLEYPPHIDICIFGLIRFTMLFYEPEGVSDSAYWESILDYLYYDKTLEECIRDNTWVRYTNREFETIILSPELALFGNISRSLKYNNKANKTYYLDPESNKFVELPGGGRGYGYKGK